MFSAHSLGVDSKHRPPDPRALGPEAPAEHPLFAALVPRPPVGLRLRDPAATGYAVSSTEEMGLWEACVQHVQCVDACECAYVCYMCVFV